MFTYVILFYLIKDKSLLLYHKNYKIKVICVDFTCTILIKLYLFNICP